ncbi:MAG TPA: RNA-binding protein [Flavisolibacter sp.]|nr:RNA-binding protein [Flavisolibacter sp.]
MNIYVANFDIQWSNEDLRNFFTPYGEVEKAEVSMDAFTDQSRGFGHVEMPNVEQELAAIAATNQTAVNGKTISVQEAESKLVHKGSYKVGDGAVNIYRFRKN